MTWAAFVKSNLIIFTQVSFFCSGIETVGRNVLVVGRSKNVGMPIAMLLHSDRNHERPGGEISVISLSLFGNCLQINRYFYCCFPLSI